MFKKLFLIATLLLTSNAHSAEYLDTQYGEDGLEVHIMKATINKNIMTVVFAFENTSDADAKYLALPIKQVYYNTQDKKYPVLQDAENKWLASTIAYGVSDLDIFSYKRQSDKYYNFLVKAGKRKVGWVKFEAPNDADWPLDLSLPNVTPFTLNKPQ